MLSTPMYGKIIISIGYTMITQNDFSVTILDSADKALYFTKENVRNRVDNYEKLLESGDHKNAVEAGSVDLF